eukprot:Gb_17021 [translate_table: standard]
MPLSKFHMLHSVGCRRELCALQLAIKGELSGASSHTPRSLPFSGRFTPTARQRVRPTLATLASGWDVPRPSNWPFQTQTWRQNLPPGGGERKRRGNENSSLSLGNKTKKIGPFLDVNLLAPTEDEIESATQYFSEKNKLGKSNFTATYKGVFRDGSIVAVKSINKMNSKIEELEFQEGLKALSSLHHENVIKLRGFCCSRGRGEGFLVYDFEPNGNLLQFFLVAKDGKVLDLSTRVRIAHGIAEGIEYLHGVHYSSVAHKKSDMYDFGIILFQRLTGRRINSSLKPVVESGRLEEFMDSNLGKNYSEAEASNLAQIALDCTIEGVTHRPAMNVVIQRLCKTHENRMD